MTGQEEKEFIRFIEEVIRTILEQPTLTKEMKSKFVNEFRKTCGDKINPLGTIGNHGSSYLSLCRLLLSHGADIHASEDGTPSPLLNACLNRHVELELEMILSQENLLAIDLNQKCRSNQSISSAFTTEFAVDGTDGTNVNTTDSFRGVRCSTPIKLLKRIGRRLYQWQEEEKKQLALNSAYQPNDVEIRQWLREQLTSVPNHLFATTMQQAMHQPLLLTSGQPPDHRESCHRDYLHRWIHQLQTAPLSTNLLEVPPNLLIHHTFLVDSFDLFLEPEFAPYVPQLLSLLDESHLSFIDGLVLFGEYVPTDYLDDIFKSISPLLTCDKLIGEKGAYQQNFLLQLMDVCMERLSYVIQVYQSESWKNNSDYLVQLRLAYGYDSTDTPHDHGLSTVLSKSLEHINNEVPIILLGLAREIGSSCSIEVFRTLWTRLEHFSLKEFSYRSEMLYQLIRSTLMNENERPMERLQSFLTDPFFFTSDLWEPFQMDRASDSSQGLNLVEIVKKLNVRVGEWNSQQNPTKIAYRQTIVDYIIQMESDWTNIHWPMIRTNLEDYLIHDVAGMVLDMLQPSKPVSLAISSQPAWTTADGFSFGSIPNNTDANAPNIDGFPFDAAASATTDTNAPITTGFTSGGPASTGFTFGVVAPAPLTTKKSKKAASAEEEDDDEEEEIPQAKAPVKKATAPSTAPKKVVYNVDPACGLSGETVHENYDAMLNQTNIGSNNNKFYRIQVLKLGNNYYCWTHWGRVGENGWNGLESCGSSVAYAIKAFEKKFNDKTSNAWDNRANFVKKSGMYDLLEMDNTEDPEDDARLEDTASGD